MVSKKKKVKTNHSNSKKKNIKHLFNQKPKETIRVKTFIVEKPVYVSAEEKPLSLREKYSKIFKEKILRKEPEEVEVESEIDDSIQEDDLIQKESKDINDYDLEDDQYTDSLEDFQKVDSSEKSIANENASHVRSNSLFNNVWWKKAILKGFLIWLIIVIFAYILEFLKLADVENAKNWFILLIVVILIALFYEKFLSGKFKL